MMKMLHPKWHRRKINGKIFEFNKSFKTKIEANEYANKLRKGKSFGGFITPFYVRISLAPKSRKKLGKYEVFSKSNDKKFNKINEKKIKEIEKKTPKSYKKRIPYEYNP